jgi:hypothetical protein
VEKAVPARAPALYLDCGTEDGLLDSNRELAAALKKRGFAYEYHEVPGDHTWDYWNRRVQAFLPWLMRAFRAGRRALSRLELVITGCCGCLSRTIGTVVLGTLGAIAVLLTVLGTYVPGESMAAMRMREMGIRAALGATRRQLGAIVVAETGRLVGLGRARARVSRQPSSRAAGGTGGPRKRAQGTVIA